MVAELTAIKNHSKGQKHWALFEGATASQPSVSSFYKIQVKKPVDAVSVAEHNLPFHVNDHMTDSLKDIFQGPETVKALQLKRTKATGIVKNVIGLS